MTKTKRLPFYERNFDNDIKFSGPLSYRHFRILGWVSMIFLVLSFTFKLLPSGDSYTTLFNLFGELALPFFLVANFSVIMRKKNDIKGMLFLYGGLSVGIILFLYAFIYRYLYCVTNALMQNALFILFEEIFSSIRGETMAHDAYSALTISFNENLTLATTFNMFVDMFLCTLTVYFVFNYPKKRFQGKKIIIFRLFALIPLFYELGAVVLKLLTSLNFSFNIPFWVIPLLPKKPPMMFIAFLGIVVFFKIRELIYIYKSNKKVYDYLEFLKTKINSLHFSLFTSILFFFVVILDFVVFIATVYDCALEMGYSTNDSINMARVMEGVINSGIGMSSSLLGVIPFLLFFNFSKEYDSSLPDLLIPIGGILLCVFTMFESLIDIIAFGGIIPKTNIDTSLVLYKFDRLFYLRN